MISVYLLNFESEFQFFTESFSLKQNYLNFDNYAYFFFFTDYSDFNFLHLIKNPNVYNTAIITFIDQLEDINCFNNLENVKSIYHYSIPNTKLAYPEPFVASASFMHTDL